MSDTILQCAPTGRLMQNYREETPATALGSIVACTDPNGYINLFTLGASNNVYCIREDPTSDTGWATPLPTGVTGPIFAAAEYYGGVAAFGVDSSNDVLMFCLATGDTGFSSGATVTPAMTVSALKAQFFDSTTQLFITSTNTAIPGGPYRTSITQIESSSMTTIKASQDQDSNSFDFITLNGSTVLAGIVTPQLYTLASGEPHKVWTSDGADNQYARDASMWRTLPPDGYIPLGDYMMPGSDFDTPLSAAVTVRQVTDPTSTVLPPLCPDPGAAWSAYWNDRHSDADDSVTVWRASTVSYQINGQTANYVAIGDVVIGNYDSDQPPPYAFINENLLVTGIIANPTPGCTQTPAELCNENCIYLIENDRGTTPAAFDSVTAGVNGIDCRVFYTHANDGLGLPTASWPTLAANPTLPSSVIYWTDAYAYNSGNPAPVSLGSPSPSAVTSYAWVTGLTGDSQLVAVLADGHLYRFSDGDWIVLDQTNTYLAVSGTSNQFGINIFALGANRQVFHLMQRSDGAWSEPVQLTSGSSVGSIAAIQDSDGNAICFAITADNQIQRIEQDDTTLDWSIEPVELEAPGTIVEVDTWSVQIVARDDDGNILANTPISVYADGVVEATLNGVGQILDPAQPVQATTNGSGILTIASIASTVTSPTFYFQTPSMQADDTSVQVQPNASIQGTLLMADPDDYVAQLGISQDMADVIAPAIQNVMTFDIGDGGLPTLVKSPVGRPRKMPGVRMVRRGEEAAARQIRYTTAQDSWELDFSTDTPVFRVLTPTEAKARAAERARLPHANGFFSWLNDIGDLIVGFFNKTIQLVRHAVDWIDEKLYTFYTIIVNGVQYVFETVVETFTDAFNAVSSFFAWIGAAFDKLVAWLGFVFAWDDMLRTAEVIDYLLTSVLGGFVTGALPVIQATMDTLIQQADETVQQAFSDLIGKLGTSSSLTSVSDDLVPETPPAYDAISGTNVFLDGSLNNGDSTTFDTTSLARLRRFAVRTQLRESGSSFEDALDQFSSDVTSDQAYDPALGGLEGDGETGTDDAMTNPLSALLELIETLVSSVLSTGQTVMDAGFDALAAAADSLFGENGLLNAELDIPFVSALYTYLTGQEALTIGGLVSLIAAIPVTIVYKLGAGVAPFPDETAVAAFKTAITADILLQGSGLGSTGTMPTADVPAVPTEVAQFFSTFNGTVCILQGFVGGATDLIPLEVPEGQTALVSVLSQIMLGLGWCNWVSAMPYLQGGSMDGFKCDGDGPVAIAWLVSVSGPAFDTLVYMFSEDNNGFGKIMRNWGNYSIVLDFCSSAASLAAACIAGAKSGNLVLALSGVAVFFPGFVRLLRIGTTAPGWQTFVPAGVDLVLNIVGGVMEIVVTFKSPSVGMPAVGPLLLAAEAKG